MEKKHVFTPFLCGSKQYQYRTYLPHVYTLKETKENHMSTFFREAKGQPHFPPFLCGFKETPSENHMVAPFLSGFKDKPNETTGLHLFHPLSVWC